MSSPRHSPPPSAAAPKPKGILKNSAERRPSQGEALSQDDDANRLQWDETNLTLHEIEREQQEARMKIDEPKTPFVHGTSLNPVGDEDMFELDGAAPSTSSGSRRSSSAADQLAANTSANAGRAPGEGLGLAVGLDAADLANGMGGTASGSEGQVRPGSARSTSRSPSFSLPPKSPSSRRSSSRSATAAAADDQRSDVRQQAHDMDVDGADDGAVEEEDADPETQAKHAAFAAKRNQHYGNEAEAMKIAAALAARDDDEDEDEEDAGGLPPVPSVPNGTAAR
ncbi:Protein phosphatase inhibitor 2 (IPP-2) [Kalmanozyma brasiliensis GHG001]|uniref:Protein phosphatase inhibitor 2 n=1 Tax=Kalmanozyma brasiliensis (strain GHG001) TaxID=1365824 RepID=V5EZU9_KALBG|nr:Protein phosphatase inhibitor 2 (IPP-2) [Kalmanozyma brasiliensis GHG001]EST09483.1 Protein phosphatase inhibitor 2 (IPP-2) [Kalmanozyma brasiliensis GHG001]